MSAAPRTVLVMLGALCVLVLTGCRVDTKVAIAVDEDGSGTVAVTVHFDADAAARVPDLTDGLRTADLAAAGWDVPAPTRDDTGVTYLLTKDFASADALAGVLAELSGPDGFLRDVTLGRSKGFAEATWTFTATVDLSDALTRTADPALTAMLGGQPLGRDQAALEKELGAPLTSMMTSELSIAMPFAVEANTPTVQGRVATWVFQAGDPAAHELRATSRTSTTVPLVWATIAGAAGFVLVVLIMPDDP